MRIRKKNTAVYPEVHIEYHADDYGMFPKQSERILNCYQYGKLNGVSVMPNGVSMHECMQMLDPHREKIAVTIHLNIIEGYCLCPPDQLPLLVDEAGVFHTSFGNLLLRSCLPGKEAYREQLKKELRAQIRAVQAFLPESDTLRLDGHAHYHMLPVVFDALMDVIREDRLKVSYIRIPREYPLLYLRHLRQLRDFSMINMVKVLVLNLLSLRNRWKYRDFLQGMDNSVFLGVFLSGRMYRENVEPLLCDAVKLAHKKGRNLEILAHPGGVYEEADIAKLTNKEDIAFLTHDLRRREASLFAAE